MMWHDLTNHEVAFRWSLSLLHFCWQGFVIAGVTAVILRFFTTAPKGRYAVCLTGLIVCFLCPLITFSVANSGRSNGATPVTVPKPVAWQPSKSQPTVAFFPESQAVLISEMTDSRPSQPSTMTWISWRHSCDVVFVVWIFGELLLALRLLFSALAGRRLTKSSPVARPELVELQRRLARQMALRQGLSLRVSKRIRSAIAIGLIQPCIVLPLSWVVNLPPDMLTAVIAHELAHIRRHDLWANLFQRVVETFLFFHPAVWWISRQLRNERELCCDQLAAKMLDNQTLYAKTLERVALEKFNNRPFALATSLGDDRMSLLKRVQNVLGMNPKIEYGRAWPAGILAVVIPIIIGFYVETDESMAQEAPPAVPVEKRVFDQPGVERALRQFDLAFRKQTKGSQTKATKTALAKPAHRKPYVIEPPDILLIQGVRLTPKSPYNLATGDFLQITVSNAIADHPIGGSFVIDTTGFVNLGPNYPKCKVEGMTIAEAQKKVTEALSKTIASPQVSVSLLQSSHTSQIFGEHLVGPDGTINLGVYGTTYVAGLTVDAARSTIEKHLSKFLDQPKVSLDVLAYNSKFYYIVTEGGDSGDQVVRMQITGNETVLDAIAQMGGLIQISRKKIWIARPASKGEKTDQILPVNWDAIVTGGSESTNYQLLAGDRVFVATDKDGATELSAEMTKQLKLFTRFMGEQRYPAAIQLAKQMMRDNPGHPVVQLMSAHADLAHRVGLEPKAEVSKVLDYNVAELVTPISNFVTIAHPRNSQEKKPATNRAEPDFDGLIRLITSTVAPNSWEEVGGTGTIQAFPKNRSLVISASAGVHEQVADLLEQMRRLRHTQLVLDVSFVSLGEPLTQNLGIRDKRVSVLYAAEYDVIMRAAKDDPYSRTHQPVRYTIFNGQKARFTANEGKEMLQGRFLVDENRKSIRAIFDGLEKTIPEFTVKDGSPILCRLPGSKSRFVIVQPSAVSRETIQ